MYFAVDAFGAIVPEGCEDVSEVPAAAYSHGLDFFNRINHTWHELVDSAKYAAEVNKVRALGAKQIASYHGPPTRGDIETHIKRIDAIGTMAPVVHPKQGDLEAMLRSMRPA
jgi:hypothetical protein